MKVFGLTGGIGMGKSTAADWLRARGIAVVDTDQLARDVVAPGQPALDEISDRFGPSMIRPDGTLDRRALARTVFPDPAARLQLEAITHPRIRQLWRSFVDASRDRGAPAAVVVIPLLFETGAESELSATICIACSAATQLQRLAARGWDKDEIRQRLDAQLSVEKKMTLSNYVVWSEGPLPILHAQLARLIPIA